MGWSSQQQMEFLVFDAYVGLNCLGIFKLPVGLPTGILWQYLQVDWSKTLEYIDIEITVLVKMCSSISRRVTCPLGLVLQCCSINELK